MAAQELSIPSLANRIQTEADAYAFLESLRWPAGQPDACPQCGTVGAKFYFLAPRDGSQGRKTRTGANTQRRVWKCGACRKQFSVLTGTVFHGSKIPVKTWLFVVFEMCASKNGVSAHEIERKYDLTAKTAWFMLHRIREAMTQGPMAALLSGTVISDEAWIGGEPKNRHADKRNDDDDKTIVMSLVHYETREVRSRVIADVTAKSLGAVIADEVAMKTTALHTDGHKAYGTIAQRMAGHVAVDHAAGQYVSGMGIGTNPAETYFSQLKRSVDGTYHHVSREHLHRYLAQFDFLYTNCRASDSARMRRLLGQVGGRRLTYK